MNNIRYFRFEIIIFCIILTFVISISFSYLLLGIVGFLILLGFFTVMIYIKYRYATIVTIKQDNIIVEYINNKNRIMIPIKDIYGVNFTKKNITNMFIDELDFFYSDQAYSGYVNIDHSEKSIKNIQRVINKK